MILKNLFIIFCSTNLVNSLIPLQNQISNESSASTAISDILQEFFIKKSIKFDFLIYGERTRHLDDVADGILGSIAGKSPLIVKHV